MVLYLYAGRKRCCDRADGNCPAERDDVSQNSGVQENKTALYRRFLE